MLRAIRVLRDAARPRSSSTTLPETRFGSLIWVTVGACWVAQFLTVTILPDRILVPALFINAAITVNCVLAAWLVRRQSLVARVAWHVGFGLIITAATRLLQAPMLGMSYSLLPLMATTTISEPAGLVTEGLVSLLVWWALPAPAAQPLTGLRWAVIAGGALTFLLGRIEARAASDAVEWSTLAYEQAQQKLAEALNQRVELKQAQDDLVLANRELARLSERLKAMQHVAEEARQAKQEFVANVSHELRTPLNMIIGFSEMIPKLSQVYGVELPPTLLGDIAAIQRNSEHLSRLVDDVLDLSQIDAGHMALSMEWASLRGIIDEAALAVRALFETKGLELQAEIPDDLPLVFCDSTRIRQVVLNLLSNAGRFTVQGGVRVKAWRERDEVIVSVADSGPGIAEKDQGKLFEPFQQLEGSIRRRHSGTGLGLSISKRFVEMHGGRMWLESKVGVGTTFYFALAIDTPLASTPPAGVDVRRSFNPYQEYRVRTRRSKAPPPDVVPRFVLLEKGKTLRHLFGHYPGELDVVSVESAEQAIADLSRSPAQGLIINAAWPRQLSAPLDALADLPFGTPTITCCVLGEDETANQLGVVHYLVKPVTREALLSALVDAGEHVKTILVADDEPEMLRLFARMLATAPRPYSVLQATSGRRALSLLRDRRPDVLLLDLAMPRMDGFQVLQAKGQDPTIAQIPTIVVSARDPAGEAVVSSTLTVTRSGGLSTYELLRCVRAVSEILAPLEPKGQGRTPGRSEQPEGPAG